jgi:hypothetical protein
MKDEGKKWAKGKYPLTSAGSMRRLLTTGVTVLFPVSNSLGGRLPMRFSVL